MCLSMFLVLFFALQGPSGANAGTLYPVLGICVLFCNFSRQYGTDVPLGFTFVMPSGPLFQTEKRRLFIPSSGGELAPTAGRIAG